MVPVKERKYSFQGDRTTPKKMFAFERALVKHADELVFSSSRSRTLSTGRHSVVIVAQELSTIIDFGI